MASCVSGASGAKTSHVCMRPAQASTSTATPARRAAATRSRRLGVEGLALADLEEKRGEARQVAQQG